MSTTVQNVVDQARIGYPSIPDVGAPSTAVNLANEVHNDILTRCGIQTDTETITLTSGTKEYSLPVTARFATSVTYVRSASAEDVVKLLSRSQEEFENESPAYKYSDSGEPTSYYITHGSDGTVSIGLDPTPDTTTSGGYPKVVMRVGRGATLTAAGNLPLGVARPCQKLPRRRRSTRTKSQNSKYGDMSSNRSLLSKPSPTIPGNDARGCDLATGCPPL